MPGAVGVAEGSSVGGGRGGAHPCPGEGDVKSSVTARSITGCEKGEIKLAHLPPRTLISSERAVMAPLPGWLPAGDGKVCPV